MPDDEEPPPPDEEPAPIEEPAPVEEPLDAALEPLADEDPSTDEEPAAVDDDRVAADDEPPALLAGWELAELPEEPDACEVLVAAEAGPDEETLPELDELELPVPPVLLDFGPHANKPPANNSTTDAPNLLTRPPQDIRDARNMTRRHIYHKRDRRRASVHGGVVGVPP